MGVTAGIFLASILLKEMRYLVYIRYLWSITTFDAYAVEYYRHNYWTLLVMQLTVFGITIQLEWFCRWLSSAQPFHLDGYAVDCLRHSDSNWMLMPLTVFGITIKLGWQSSHNRLTWMVMPMTFNGITIQYLRWMSSTWIVMPLRQLTGFGITIQLKWLCRWLSSA
jgi:hypothetical protein